MCLIGVYLQPQVAEEDIVCYKIIGSDMRSDVFNFQYKLGKVYSKRKPLTVTKEVNDIPFDFGNSNYFKGIEELETIHRGYHSYINLEWLYEQHKPAWLNERYSNSLIAKCIIPKGSTYYTGRDNATRWSENCYVSTRIKLIETVPFAEYKKVIKQIRKRQKNEESMVYIK